MTSRNARLSPRSSLTATRCAIAVLLTASAVAVQPAWAARLGHSRVVSAQNAPLQVVIPLTDLTPDERASLRIAVADAEAWQRAGLKPPVSLASMRLTAEVGADASQRIVRLTSAEVATDPAVDVLLSIGSGAGQRLVQLTVMQSAQGFPGLTSQATVGTSARGSGGGGSVAVRQGDTLYGIAQSHALADATIYQMLVALWRANPQAFIGNNMNRVKAGARLVVPDASTVRAIDPGEARRIFLEQAEAYARYRAGLAGAAGRGTAAVPAPTTSGQVGSGAPAVQPDAGAQDRLRLSSGVPGQGAEAAAQSRADAETSSAKATQDARSRVDELERNVKDLNAALAQQGQGGQGAGGSGAGASGAGASGAGGSGLTVTGLTLPGGPGAIAQAGQGAGGGAGAGGQGAGGVAAGGQASATGQAGGQAAAGGQFGASGQAGPNGQPAANATTGAGGQPGTMGAGAGARTGAGTDAGSNTGTGSGEAGAAGQGGATGQPGGNVQGNAGAGATGANAGANTGTGMDTGNAAVGSANNPGSAGAANSGGAAGSGGAGSGSAASGTAGAGGATSSTGASTGTGPTGAGSNSGTSSSNPGASTPGANPSGSATASSASGSANLGGAADADRAAGATSANGGNSASAGGKAAQPTSALPRWLSDNLLIVMTLVLTLIAFVIAWLLRRAGARREDDEDDDLDEDLYATEIDPAAIDRRLDGIDLDLDSKPTDASIRREPGVAPRNPARS
ncbi:FimV family protein [Bordetella sp. LUAb4]|uniref:type IV pilus assembly protein FimV n=1 Tax=Bordetella sp. LUAb4 TaxID=2843195 RepID=UPI001E506C94|nr:FimV/HubP family polar landmark protein [Bordetella sp. LUAb4]